MAQDVGGVEFFMELNAKFDEATKLLREMTKVQAESAKLDAALKKAGRSTSLFTDGLNKAGGAFKSVGADMVGHLGALATFEGIKRIGGWLFDIGREALQAAGEAQRLRYSFQLMMGVEPANELLDYLDGLASKTEFTDGALKGFASNLTRAGFAGEGLRRALGATIDLAAMSQDKMAGAAEAVALLSKVSLKGGVSERELVSAGLSPQTFFKRVSDETGIGLANVEKQIQAGKVKTGVLLESLYSEVVAKTGKEALGGAGVGMSKSFLAQVEKAGDIIPNLFEELEKTGGLEDLTAGLERLSEGLAPNSPAGRRIVTGLTQMVDTFGKLVKDVDFDAWSGRLVSAIELFTGVVQIGAAVGGELGMLFGKFTLFGESLGESLAETVGYIGEFFDAGWEIGKNLWRGLVDGITGKVSEVVDSVKFLGGEAIAALKGVLGISSPSKVFAGFGGQTAAGFELGIMRALPGVADAVAQAFSPLALLPALGPPPIPALFASGAGAAAAAAAPALAVGAGPRLQANITLNISVGGGGEGLADEIAAKAGAGLRQEFEALLAEVSLQGGAA